MLPYKSGKAQLKLFGRCPIGAGRNNSNQGVQKHRKRTLLQEKSPKHQGHVIIPILYSIFNVDIKIISLSARLKKWLRYRVRVTQQLENSHCCKLLGTCLKTFGKVDVVSGKGAVFYKMQLFSFVLKV